MDVIKSIKANKDLKKVLRVVDFLLYFAEWILFGVSPLLFLLTLASVAFLGRFDSYHGPPKELLLLVYFGLGILIFSLHVKVKGFYSPGDDLKGKFLKVFYGFFSSVVLSYFLMSLFVSEFRAAWFMFDELATRIALLMFLGYLAILSYILLLFVIFYLLLRAIDSYGRGDDRIRERGEFQIGVVLLSLAMVAVFGIAFWPSYVQMTSGIANSADYERVRPILSSIIFGGVVYAYFRCLFRKDFFESRDNI